MAFAIVGIAKQKGGSVGSSGHHNDRTRETPNADPERAHLNRVLFGEDGNVREAVDSIIEAHGGKPRSDSVEAVEFVLTASPEWFDEKDPERYHEKVERFTEQAMKFLEDPRSGGVLAKAVLHMDERTPHVQAHKVPIDPEGKLNAKYYFGGRQKMGVIHDLYAEYMQPLGLERGKRGSRARHETLKRFYASVEQEVKLEVNRARIPDPPRMMLMQEARDQYKLAVYEAVLTQAAEQVQTLRHQAMLAKDERAHRVEAERRAEKRVTEVLAAAREQITKIEATAREQIAKVERVAADRFTNLQRSAQALLDENKELRAHNDNLREQRNELNELLGKERWYKQEFQKLARERGDRLTDIPMPEVMERLGYDGELNGQAHIYWGEQNVVAMRIEQHKAFDSQNRLICRNSLDLVVHMRRNNEGRENFTPDHALAWLRDEFGESRAAGAYVVNREQSVYGLFERTREDREIVRSLHPQDRDSSRSHVAMERDSHDRGGRGFER